MGSSFVATPLLSTPGRTVLLYERPAIQQFTRKTQNQLRERLVDLDNTTTIHTIGSEEEFQLDPRGRTKVGGYRFTYLAFAQIAKLMAVGLSKLLPDISGSITLPDDREFLVDGGLAIDLWNRMVELRFSLLHNHRVIRNDRTKQIEGVIGNRHQYLENAGFYEAASEIIPKYQPDVNFHGAMIVGRRMAMWFRAKSAMFELDVDGTRWPFYHGYYFTNGEATGTAVRGALVVFSQAGLCLAPYAAYGGRMTHTGRDFYTRFGQMLMGVVNREVPVAKLHEGAKGLLSTDLGFQPTMMKPDRKQQQRRLVHALTHLGIPKNLAAEVVENALTKGRNLRKGTFFPHQDVSRVYSKRTLLDLLIPLLELARHVDLSRREKIEQAAFDVLTGRILITRSGTNGTTVSKKASRSEASQPGTGHQAAGRGHRQDAEEVGDEVQPDRAAGQ